MKILIKSLIIFISFIICCSSLRAENNFKSVFEMEPGKSQNVADKITQYYLGEKAFSDGRQTQQLENLSDSLKKHIQSDPDNPGLYFLNGLNLSFLAVNYKATNNKDRFESVTKEKIASYKKAMELDKLHDPHLSAIVYSVMKHGLPEDLKIKAIQSELKLGGSGENESNYWFLHWSNIDALQTAGRDKEAEQAFKNMQKELKERKPGVSQYNIITKQARRNLKPAPEKVKNNQPDETKSIQDREGVLIWIISILSVISLLSVYLIKRR